MAIDGNKLRKIRMAKGISQEKLALMCHVNKRTIQRAEKGQPVALETVAFIAEAVQVTPAALRSAQLEMFEPKTKAWNDVILIPVTSCRRIVDVLRSSFDADLSFDVEPTQENIALLAKLAELLEPFKPNPWEAPQQAYNPGYSEILERQADVNAILPSLSTMGIGVFLATYASLRQIPHYDMDEGHMYTTSHTPNSKVEIALIVVSDTSASHLVRNPSDIHSEDLPF
ncbi:helix-turn-helix domain-containing protein [Rhizobium leguminosarum]|uniref:helix-turn-helix domain-containing protein n=1 Tax=Rhizobium leguminosarum TaxID=384 RepID=UPI003F957046